MELVVFRRRILLRRLLLQRRIGFNNGASLGDLLRVPCFNVSLGGQLGHVAGIVAQVTRLTNPGELCNRSR